MKRAQRLLPRLSCGSLYRPQLFALENLKRQRLPALINKFDQNGVGKLLHDRAGGSLGKTEGWQRLQQFHGIPQLRHERRVVGPGLRLSILANCHSPS